MRILVAAVSARRVVVLELAGAASIIGGVAAQWGSAAGWIAGGAFSMLKAFELDLSRVVDDEDAP